MTTITIQTSEISYTRIPNFIVNDESFTAEALAVVTYLIGKPNGWEVRVYDIKRRFAWGDHKWRAVSKLLRDHGLLEERKHKDGTALIFKFNWNDYKGQKPPVDFRTVQKPTRGKSTGIERKIETNKDLLKNHDHVKQKENEATRTASEVELALPHEEKYMLERLLNLGMVKPLALKIVQLNSVATINNIIESGLANGVKNMGAYINTSIARNANETTETKT